MTAAALPLMSRVLEARERLRSRVRETPCRESGRLSELTGAKVLLKLESLQPTGSFKERGAANRLLLLTAEERRRGVIAASAGNHAQAVARHATLLGIPATVVMPVATPLVKMTAARHLGATVVLSGASYDEASEHAAVLAAERGLTVVHPFEDLDVIAGQGTIGLELLEQVPDLGAVIVPVGGGGLIAGIGEVLATRAPSVRVIGVESRAFPGMRRALAGLDAPGMTDPPGSTPKVLGGKTIADGIAVRRVGKLTRAIVERTVESVVLVDEEEIAEAILLLLEGDKTVAEGAGAVGVAALARGHVHLEGLTVAVVVSGGNIDVNLVSRIIERGLVKTGRLVRFFLVLPDVTGSLAELTTVIARSGANVLEINHDRTFAGIELGQTFVELVLETRGPEHVGEVRARLAEQGYRLRAPSDSVSVRPGPA
jgi:threonine dehydratase